MGCNCGKNKGRSLKIESADAIRLQNTPQNQIIPKSGNTNIKEQILEPSPVERDPNKKLLNIEQLEDNPIKNLIQAASQQKNKIKWFKDGLTGIFKCLSDDVLYTDEDIQKNRDVCRECPFSTKDKKNKLTMTSQCMAKDPNTGAPCGCFILCKTQADKCPLNKWTTVQLTIDKND